MRLLLPEPWKEEGNIEGDKPETPTCSEYNRGSEVEGLKEENESVSRVFMYRLRMDRSSKL